ncbi:hypothetical protein HPSH465_1586, partial [Glaesserella parasuis H465]
SVGILLAVAGVLLQRLTLNPNRMVLVGRDQLIGTV